MTTRRQQLFEARKKSTGSDVIPSTVSFKLDRKKGALTRLSAVEKMKCALRKALAFMSNNDENRRRYYIDGDIRMVRAPTSSAGREDEPRSYRAAGICRVGVCHPQGHKSSKVIRFDINYRDTKDAHGQPDVMYFDPTTIDELPRNTRVSP